MKNSSTLKIYLLVFYASEMEDKLAGLNEKLLHTMCALCCSSETNFILLIIFGIVVEKGWNPLWNQHGAVVHPVGPGGHAAECFLWPF